MSRTSSLPSPSDLERRGRGKARCERRVRRPVGATADRDDDHRCERGVLLAPAKALPGGLETPRRYAPLLEADPIIYVSPAETERMQRLARERLPRFLALRDRFAKNRKWSRPRERPRFPAAIAALICGQRPTDGTRVAQADSARAACRTCEACARHVSSVNEGSTASARAQGYPRVQVRDGAGHARARSG